MKLLMPPLHDLGAHLYKPILRIAGREAIDCLDGIINIVLRKGSRLFYSRAARNYTSGLVDIVSMIHHQ